MNSGYNPWHGKVGNVHQIGGIETSVLDNGPGRGVRVAWIDTGAGLRYQVVLDRGMDISSAFYESHSLAWLSQVGITPPSPFSDKGLDWLRTFGGGLLTTCGLSHVGGPEEDNQGQRGLHGRISNNPAEIISIKQPDLLGGDLNMQLIGVVRESRVFGPHLVLKRTISGILGQPYLKITDEVINESNVEAPHMLLYHVNFGWPLVDEGSQIVWNGSWKSRDGDSHNRIFNSRNDFKRCPAPLDEHAGFGEDVAFIDPEVEGDNRSRAGIYNSSLGFALRMTFDKRQLPNLVNWQHWGENEYVTALEPGTHPPIGQAKAREEGSLILLKPGEKRTYDLMLDVLTDSKGLKSFTNTK
ncbi:aldose 1-epimerase family protein [Cyclobacterium jeungdonense]|uniref:Aldose 1-epimerase family protein n=1 Tax=Cyclobacterium jeungdonense TaxID=708087 RepID=A0ABT8CAY7_9BACT|nr:aldose 1-epimerase family protein [Cyclobacterium jeungdonense]MDN3689675.1 aldose 1-epimerase family protein [Cyclobacterium jeungdonense]